jgi:hypothetical protein
MALQPSDMIDFLIIPGSIHFNGWDAKTYPEIESLLKRKKSSKRS